MPGESAITRLNRVWRRVPISKMPRLARHQTGAVDFQLHFNGHGKY